MNRFQKQNKCKRFLRAFSLSIVAFIGIMIAFIYGISNVADSDTLNEKALLEDALQRNIVHCYAVEGSYPPSLSYIEEHYGLLYNKDKFLISYENIGSNLLPVVHIIER